MASSRHTISVVIPALNEAAGIVATVARVRQLRPDAEVIVVDGGSHDRTAGLARHAGARVVVTRTGRGIQCETGSRTATADTLLFLHADTWLPDNAFTVIDSYLADPTFTIGTFRLAFDNSHPLLRFYAWVSRFDTVFTRFGDQGIVVRRRFLTEIGGFPVTRLFEDVELLRRARRRGRIRRLPATVRTSARRFLEHGIVREQVANARLMLRYLLGVHPNVLDAERRRVGLRKHDADASSVQS